MRGVYVTRTIVLCGVLAVLTAPAVSAQTISQSGWTLQSVDSEETQVCCYQATNAFDGNASTMWATRWSSASPAPPHEIQINLGATYSLTGFRYLPRQDGQTEGRIATYEFYVSTDGTTWGTAVATGTFANNATEKQVAFTAKTGRYVRLRAMTSVSNAPWTTAAELNVVGTPTQPAGNVIPHTNWTLQSVDSQETQVCCYTAANAFDSNATTMWATRWSSASPMPPHEIQINLGAVYDVNGFRYLPRQDGESAGNIGQFEFYVSTDGTTWGTAVATGTFANSAAEKQVTFTAKTGRFVRLRALSEVSGSPWTTVAELNVLAGGTPPSNQPPNGTITSPTGDVTIAPGQSVSFAGSGTDPENSPLTYAWNFGTGGPPASTSQNPGAVTFPNAGTYQVTFTVTDSQGSPDPTPATRTITVQGSATGAVLISQANWSLRFVSSEETVGGNNAATRAFDGNPNTNWYTQWLNGGPPPPHEIQINLGASNSVTGFRYLPVQSTQAGRVGDYEFYVSTDGVNWGAPVASGAFPDLNAGDAIDVLFAPKTGQYIRFRILSEVNDNYYPFGGIAELNVWRDGAGANQPPTLSVASPAGDVVVPAGSAVLLSGSASDPNGPLTFRWSVGGMAGVPDSRVAQPGYVHFDRAGTFNLTFTAADSLGKVSSITRTVTVTSGQLLSNAGWSVRYVDSEDVENGNTAARAIDGNPNTIWSTSWVSSQPPPPHKIGIDLGAARPITGFRYLPRQDGFDFGNIGQYEFYVSADGVDWGTPVATGTFANDASEKEVGFVPKTGRYVLLNALSEVAFRPYTVVAELRVLTSQCAAPSVRLAKPRTGYLQVSPNLSIEADACLGGAGQGVRFTVDGGAPTNDFTAPYAISVSGLSRAEHLVEAQLIDASGNPVSGAATYDRSTRVGRGDYYVAMGDGITVGFGDDRPSDDNSADGRNGTAGYTGPLADMLTSARGYPVKVANEGVSGAASSNGVAIIASVLALHPEAQYVMINYGHNDHRDGIASGLGLHPGDPGYADSFKDHIQTMIDAIRAAGKLPLLSKAAPQLPLGSAADQSIQLYNMVMDELAAIPANGVPRPPVDFYTYFRNNSSTVYSANGVEPNGLGHLAMAQLWLQVLTP
jgi:lysophospholipase L1-like esterase